MTGPEKVLARASELAGRYASFPSVEAVVMAGSRVSDVSEANSDLDLYVYSTQIIPITEREGIAKAFSNTAEINNTFWEPGDEWYDSQLAIGIDIMYRTPEWMQHQLDRVLKQHQASLGYSTCFWYNVLNSKILFDRKGWFEQLQRKSNVPYPEELRQAIVSKNYPVLRKNYSSYAKQIQKAIERKDFVSMNHRIAAFLASYFDILFAINRIPHPGEKRLVPFAKQNCKNLPDNLDAVERLLSVNDQIADIINELCDGLDQLLNVGL